MFCGCQLTRPYCPFTDSQSQNELDLGYDIDPSIMADIAKNDPSAAQELMVTPRIDPAAEAGATQQADAAPNSTVGAGTDTTDSASFAGAGGATARPRMLQRGNTENLIQQATEQSAEVRRATLDLKGQEQLRQTERERGQQVKKGLILETAAQDLNSTGGLGGNTWSVGQTVEARFGGHRDYHKGEITAINADGTYAVKYADGAEEQVVEAAYIRDPAVLSATKSGKKPSALDKLKTAAVTMDSAPSNSPKGSVTMTLQKAAQAQQQEEEANQDMTKVDTLMRTSAQLVSVEPDGDGASGALNQMAKQVHDRNADKKKLDLAVKEMEKEREAVATKEKVQQRRSAYDEIGNPPIRARARKPKRFSGNLRGTRAGDLAKKSSNSSYHLSKSRRTLLAWTQVIADDDEEDEYEEKFDDGKSGPQRRREIFNKLATRVDSNDKVKKSIERDGANYGPEVARRAGKYTKLDDIINCTFKPERSVLLDDKDVDLDEDKPDGHPEWPLFHIPPDHFIKYAGWDKKHSSDKVSRREVSQQLRRVMKRGFTRDAMDSIWDKLQDEPQGGGREDDYDDDEQGQYSISISRLKANWNTISYNKTHRPGRRPVATDRQEFIEDAFLQFIKRAEADTRKRDNDIKQKAGQQDYQCRLNNKICPNCTLADGSPVQQSYDEYMEKRKKCPNCQADYVPRSSWDKLKKKFMEKQEGFHEKKQATMQQMLREVTMNEQGRNKPKDEGGCVVKEKFNKITGKIDTLPLFRQCETKEELENVWDQFVGDYERDLEQRRDDDEMWRRKRQGKGNLIDPECTFQPAVNSIQESGMGHLIGMHDRITQFTVEERMEDDVRTRAARQKENDAKGADRSYLPRHLLNARGWLLEERTNTAKGIPDFDREYKEYAPVAPAKDYPGARSSIQFAPPAEEKLGWMD